jgi:hypothetical protein
MLLDICFSISIIVCFDLTQLLKRSFLKSTADILRISILLNFNYIKASNFWLEHLLSSPVVQLDCDLVHLGTISAAIGLRPETVVLNDNA